MKGAFFMRTIKKLINTEKKVYILLKNKAIQYRFMSDAEREGITYGDNVKPTERKVDDIMGFATKWDNLLLGMGRANVLPLQQRECASY
jgi:hypothetical protein